MIIIVIIITITTTNILLHIASLYNNHVYYIFM